MLPSDLRESLDDFWSKVAAVKFWNQFRPEGLKIKGFEMCNDCQSCEGVKGFNCVFGAIVSVTITDIERCPWPSKRVERREWKPCPFCGAPVTVPDRFGFAIVDHKDGCFLTKRDIRGVSVSNTEQNITGDYCAWNRREK